MDKIHCQITRNVDCALKTICGANCDTCGFRESCKGCAANCGRPFGGKCAAAEYIKGFGKAAHDRFKAELLAEINAALEAGGLPQASLLNELPGSVINPEYPLPSGASVRLLDDQRICLGCQIPLLPASFTVLQRIPSSS
jgi:hypothetical protein